MISYYPIIELRLRYQAFTSVQKQSDPQVYAESISREFIIVRNLEYTKDVITYLINK